jgi:hypothetical protein
MVFVVWVVTMLFLPEFQWYAWVVVFFLFVRVTHRGFVSSLGWAVLVALLV